MGWPFGALPPIGPPTAPALPPPPQKPSILDRLAARLFPTGAYSGLLDPSQQHDVQHQGLMQLGANLLQAGGRSPQQRGTLANIGTALGGVNVNDLAQRALQLQAYRSQQQEQQLLATVAARHPIPANASQGETYNSLAAMITEMAAIPGGAAIAEKFAPVLAALKPAKPDQARWSFQTIMEGGEPVLYRINEDTGVKYRVGAGKPAASLGSVSNMETRAAAQNAIAALDDADAALAKDKNADIQPTAASVARGAKSVPLIGSALGGALEPVAQSQMSEPQKQFQQAMDQFLHNYASILPRGGRSIAILQNLRDSFAPKPGQTSAETRAAFTQARAHLRHSLEALARGEAPSIPLPTGVSAPVVTAPPEPSGTAIPIAPAYNPRWWRVHE